MSSISLSSPIYSPSQPPYSVVMLNFPSEYAPAPPKPFVIEHAGRHCPDLFCGHLSSLCSSTGQRRSSMLLPLSNTKIFKSGLFLISSYAHIYPLGPAPTMMTLYFFSISVEFLIAKPIVRGVVNMPEPQIDQRFRASFARSSHRRRAVMMLSIH